MRPGAPWQTALWGAAALALGLGTLALVWLLARPLALLFGSAVIALALAPAAEWLSRRIPRAAAIVLVYLALLLVLGFIGFLVVPTLVEQARQVFASLPSWLERARAALDGLNVAGERRILDAIGTLGSALGGTLVSLPVQFLSGAGQAALVLVMSIYYMFAAPKLHGFFLSLFPRRHQEHVEEVLGEVGHTIGGYTRAVALDGLILGLVTYTGYRLIELDYALVLALLAGLGPLVPVVVVGFWVSAVPALGVALLESPLKAIIVVAFFVVVQQLEGDVLMPNLMRRQTDISPLLVIFAFFAGAYVGGILGALIAIPLAGALRVLVLLVVAPAVRRRTGASEPEEGGGNSEPPHSECAGPDPSGAPNHEVSKSERRTEERTKPSSSPMGVVQEPHLTDEHEDKERTPMDGRATNAEET